MDIEKSGLVTEEEMTKTSFIDKDVETFDALNGATSGAAAGAAAAAL